MSGSPVAVDLERLRVEDTPLGTVRRYARVHVACLRNCLARELEFRSSFLLTAGSTVLWAIFSMALAGMIFTNVRQVGDWDLDRMLVLTGTFLIADSLSSAFIQRSMQRLAEMINKGELDFVLTRPISSQFLVSVRYVDFGDLPTSVVGVGYVVFGLGQARDRAGAPPGRVVPGDADLCAGLALRPLVHVGDVGALDAGFRTSRW